jgi:hypothetical protein
MDSWDRWDPNAAHRPLDCIRVGSTSVAPGDRVRLRPLGSADILDLVLQGMIATVDSIEQDFEGQAYLAVTVDEDPGSDLGMLQQPGHRFFFKPEEIEPHSTAETAR